jgi:hypothetical protein
MLLWPQVTFLLLGVRIASAGLSSLAPGVSAGSKLVFSGGLAEGFET